MKSVDFAFYEYTDAKGKKRRSPCRLTAEDASARYENPIRIEYTVEVRQVPESTEESYTLCTSYRRPEGQ